MLSKFFSFISLVRLLNVIITFISVITAIILCLPDYNFSKNYLFAAIAAALATAAGNIINDVFDKDADSINKPDRALPSGKISVRAAINFYIIVSLTSISAAYLINQTAFLIVLLSNILLFLYSFSLKKILFLGNIIISFLTGFIFIFGGIIAGNIKAVLVPAGFAFLINLAREGIKTLEDVPGDSKAGVITFPSRYGINFSKNIISVFLILLLIFTFIPYINGFYGIKYFAIVIIIIDPLLLYVIKSLNKENHNLNKLSLILKLNMVIGLIAVLVGR